MPSSRKQRSRPRPTDTKSRIRRGRPKVCMLCKDRVTHVDYKDSSLLRRFMSRARQDQVAQQHGHVHAAPGRGGAGHQKRPGDGPASLCGADAGR